MMLHIIGELARFVFAPFYFGYQYPSFEAAGKASWPGTILVIGLQAAVYYVLYLIAKRDVEVLQFTGALWVLSWVIARILEIFARRFKARHPQGHA